MKIHPVGAKLLLHVGSRMDRQTERHNTANYCFPQLCECSCKWTLRFSAG